MTKSSEQVRADVFRLSRLGKHAEAIARVDAELGNCERRNRHRLMGYRSHVKWAAGDRPGAIADLLSAIELQPSWVGHHCNVMLYMAEENRFDQAIKYADSVVEMEERRNSDAFSDLALLVKAIAYLRLGDATSAGQTITHVRNDGDTWICGELWNRKRLVEALKP